MQKKGFAYKPWVQFANPHFDGHLLTTDTSGFRVTPGSIDRDSPVLVYVFGGSTTFGYRVPNSYTIPSQLQQSLNKRQLGKAFVVKNYGQGYYYSSQILFFISLLKSGNIPKYAVFVDGANDTALLSKGVDQPYFTEIISEAWDLKNGRVEKPFRIPMMRLAQAIRQRVLGRTKSPPADQKDRSVLPEADAARCVVDRYRQNQRIIRALCKEYDVVPIFV